MINSTTDTLYPYNDMYVNAIYYTNYAEISSIMYSIKWGKAIHPDGISIKHISQGIVL